MLKKLCLLVFCLLISPAVFAQSAPSGEGPWRGIPIWVGAEFSTFNPDYGCNNASAFACWNSHLYGVTTYVTANHLLRGLGVDAEARLLHWGGPGYMTQTSYLAGPRLEMLHFRQLTVSPKFSLGKSRVSLQQGLAGSGTYFTIAMGAVLDYRLSTRVSARVDYEYQRLPSFKGDGSGKGGLTPNGFSFGVSYMLLR